MFLEAIRGFGVQLILYFRGGDVAASWLINLTLSEVE